MKDRVVVEFYLEAVAELRAAIPVLPIIFASSNVYDYTDVAGSKLLLVLAQDYKGVGLGSAHN